MASPLISTIVIEIDSEMPPISPLISGIVIEMVPGEDRTNAPLGGYLLRDGSLAPDRLEAARAFSSTVDDKDLTPLASSGNGSTTGISLTHTPMRTSASGYVQVYKDGYLTNLRGDTSGDCYFSDDGGTTAKCFSLFTAGDTLYWNGTISGGDLTGSERIDLVYFIGV